MQEDKYTKQIHELQARFFGQRYVGANLGSVRLGKLEIDKISNWLKNQKGILLICGNPGCGKTYICSAIVSWMFGKVADIYAHKESKFFEKIRDSMDRLGDYRSEIEYQCDHELLIYDDIGSTGEGKTDWRKEVIFELINIRYESQRPTVLATNYNYEQVIQKLGERTYSRLFSKENTYIDLFPYPDLRNPIVPESK